MAVVMLTEGCTCNGNNDLFRHLVNNQNKTSCCPPYVGEAPFLSSRWGDWFRENICPACHRIIDNLGDAVSNLATDIPAAYGGLVTTTVNAAGQIVQGVGQGVGGFISNPQNIPCAAGAVGAAFGVPLGMGGCVPQGFNEQNSTFVPQASILDNPLVLAGLGVLAVLLITKK